MPTRAVKARENDMGQLLLQLTQLLKENGDDILKGSARFTLSARCLCHLCELSKPQEDLAQNGTPGGGGPGTSGKTTLDEVLPADAAFVSNLVSQTPRLKIMHTGGPLNGAVKIRDFVGLKDLEIQRLPIHMLEGLKQLRNQLEHLSVTHSLQSLQEVLEVCGGDQSSPMTWPALRSLDVSFNEITELDASLRLLPQLEVLNLSHNRIRITERCLEYLTLLRHIDLGFNRLNAVPSFSLTTNTHLVTLGLAYNRLSDIQGVEVLVGLEVLDLSGNCLMRHSSLRPLSRLIRLRMLRLLDNPLCGHEQHRQLVLLNVSQFVDISQFRLDDRPLSKAEVKIWRCGVHLNSGARQGQLERGGSASLSGSPADGPQVTATNIQVGRIKSRKRRRPRRTLIADLDSSTTEISSRESSRAPSPVANGTAASSSTRREVERLRQHLGPLWLAAVSQSLSVPTAAAGDGVAQSPGSAASSPAAFAAAALSQRRPPLEPSVPSAKTTKDSATDGREDTLQNDLIITQAESHQERRSPSQGETITDSVDGKCHADPPSVVSSLHGQDQAHQVLQEQPSRVKQPHGKPLPLLAITSPSNKGYSGHVSSADQHNQNLLSPTLSAVEEASPLTPGDSGLEWFRTEEEEAEMYGDESEPFIVQTGPKGDTLLVSLNERYVLEKNLDGKVVERLDLTSLYSVSCPELEQGELKGHTVMAQTGPQLSLKFDYIRKDRRRRLYIMEDEEHREKLQDLLQPFLEQRAQAANLTTNFQCLVCSQEWEVTRCQPSKWNASFSAEDLSDEEEGKSCPKCGSGQVIQLESSTSTNAPASISSSQPAASMPTMTEGAGEDLSVLHNTALGASPDLAVTGSRRRSNAFLLSREEDTPAATTFCSTRDRLDYSAGSSPKISESVNQFAPRGLSFPNLQQGAVLEGRISSSLQTGRQTFFPQPALHSSHSEIFSRLEAVQAAEQARNAGDHARESGVQCQRLHSEDSDIAVLGAPSDTGQGAGGGEGGQGGGETEGGLLSTTEHVGSPVSVLDSVSHSLASSVLWNSLHGDLVSGDASASSLPSASNSQLPGSDSRDEEEENEEVSIYDMAAQKPVSFVVGTPSSLEPHSLPSVMGTRGTAGVERRADIGAQSSSFSGLERRRTSELLGDIDILPDRDLASSSGEQTGRLLPEEEHEDSQQTSQYTAWDKPHTGPSASEEEDDEIVPLQSHSDLGTTEDPAQELTGLRGDAVDGEAGRGQCQADGPQTADCLSEASPFMQVDHHLKLFLLMSVFQDDEECLGAMTCDYVQYMMEKEYPGMLVISSSRIYILKVLSDQPSECPESWLQVVDAQPLGELRYVDPGLGHQTVRLEFNTELSCFTLILRDAQRTKAFLHYLEETLTRAAMQSKEQLNAVINDDPDPEAMGMIQTDVLAHSSTEHSLLAYLMGFIARGIQARFPVSFVVSQDDVCLVRENHQYPVPRLQVSQDWASVGKRYTVLERRPISAVAGLTVDVENPCRLRITFSDEEAEEEMSWLVTMETESGRQQLLQAVGSAWEAVFGVAVEVTQAKLRWDEDEPGENSKTGPF